MRGCCIERFVPRGIDEGLATQAASVALRAEWADAPCPSRVVNECGADGGPSVGARIVSCYHPIYPVVVLVIVLARVFTEQWNRQCGWYENKDLALKKRQRHLCEECLKRDLSTCCTKPRKQHAIKQENDTSNKVSIFSARSPIACRPLQRAASLRARARARLSGLRERGPMMQSRRTQVQGR
jgi:hypothetical protein